MHTSRLSVCVLFALCACKGNPNLLKGPPEPPPPIDNFLRVSGNFCTEDPNNVEFPVKILFIVDVSASMLVTDPPNPADSNYTARARAVIDVVNSLAGQKGVEVGILTFSAGINDATMGFQPIFTAQEVAAMTQAAANLSSSVGSSNFEGALDAAYQILLDDIQLADDLKRARSQYTVIFITDGLPDPVEFDPPANTNEIITGIVEDMQDLEREQRLDQLKIHTAYLSGTTPPPFQGQPIALLRQMSENGAGTFRNIGNGEKINFLDIGFTAFRRVFQLDSFIAKNINARPYLDLVQATDSDGDGLTDVVEEVIGTDPGKFDTDGDGFNDLLEDRLSTAGFDPLDGSDADCAVTPDDDFNRRDEDGDGLLNCEERFLGTNQRVYDSDADGMPDLFEVLEQLSAVDDDFFGDLDRDGTKNGFELRDRTNPRVDDRELWSRLRYRYDVREIEIKESQVCYRFSVENIQLVPALSTGPMGPGWNDIWITYGQVPADDPDDFGEFRVACVRAYFDLENNVKRPVNGTIRLEPQYEGDPVFRRPANFEDPNDPEIFDPERHCINPAAPAPEEE